MKIVNFCGIDIRIVGFEDGMLSIRRFYKSQGDVLVKTMVEDGVALDVDVHSGLLKYELEGLPQAADEMYIVRMDVAIAAAMAQLGYCDVPAVLVPYDPVLVPREMLYDKCIAEADCRVAHGMLRDPEAQTLQEEGYVFYGYQRLITPARGDGFPYRLMLPTSADAWPTDSERNETFRQWVAELKPRLDALGDATSLPSFLRAAVETAEADGDAFVMDDAMMSFLTLQLERQEMLKSISL